MDVLHDQVLSWWSVDLRGHSLFFYTDKYTPTYATHCTYLNPFFVCMLQRSQIYLLLECIHTFINSYNSCFVKRTNYSSESSCTRPPCVKFKQIYIFCANYSEASLLIQAKSHWTDADIPALIPPTALLTLSYRPHKKTEQIQSVTFDLFYLKQVKSSTHWNQ